jgi:hypothetical protein
VDDDVGQEEELANENGEVKRVRILERLAHGKHRVENGGDKADDGYINLEDEVARRDRTDGVLSDRLIHLDGTDLSGLLLVLVCLEVIRVHMLFVETLAWFDETPLE